MTWSAAPGGITRPPIGPAVLSLIGDRVRTLQLHGRAASARLNCAVVVRPASAMELIAASGTPEAVTPEVGDSVASAFCSHLLVSGRRPLANELAQGRFL